jgi:hypothetical protein
MTAKENSKTVIDACFPSVTEEWNMASDEPNNLIYWIKLFLTVVKLRIRYL